MYYLKREHGDGTILSIPLDGDEEFITYCVECQKEMKVAPEEVGEMLVNGSLSCSYAACCPECAASFKERTGH